MWQSTVSSNFLHAVTIIKVFDIDKLNKLAATTGNQTQVSGPPEFLAFYVDLIDQIICCEAYGGISQKRALLQIMIATVDVAFYV